MTHYVANLHDDCYFSSIGNTQRPLIIRLVVTRIVRSLYLTFSKLRDVHNPYIEHLLNKLDVTDVCCASLLLYISAE